jgi:hypothetical protein
LRLTFRATATSGWIPASILTLATAVVLSAYDTPISQVAIFAAYLIFGIALPGMLWVRLLRGRATHVSEDLTLGLAVGYCVEIATYIATRAVGAPLLFVLWPILTLLAFVAIPSLRRHWRGGGERAPIWWSWSLAAMAGYLLIYSAGTFFGAHHLTGTDTPFVDMPYHLALIGELKHHVPPQIPYVTGVPLAYHWFFYVEAAATSWATGLEPVTLLYRLSGLPMFAVFAVLTAAAARRLTGGWWSGPVAAAVALFGTVAGPYLWTDAQRLSLGIKATPVFDTQTLLATWTSPTNLFGLALFAAALLLFIDLLKTDAHPRRSEWLLAGLLVFGVAGAKASLLPLLIVGMAAVLAGVGLSGRRLHRGALGGLALAVVGLAWATIVLFRGSSGGLILGIRGLQAFPIAVSVGARLGHGIALVTIPIAVMLVALVLWSFLWAGAYGLLARWRESGADPRILLLLGVCAAGLGAVTFFLYPGLSQLYYLRGAAGAFGLITVAGIAAILPDRARRGPLIAAMSMAALVGAAAVTTIKALGPSDTPMIGQDRLSAVLMTMIVPVLALVAVAAVTYFAARRAERRIPLLLGAAPLLVVGMTMGFSLPNVAGVLAPPFSAEQLSSLEGGVAAREIPSDGIDAARWLRDHSDPTDLVATNLHCRKLPQPSDLCDARHFWISAYAERRMLVEGWAYTPAAQDEATRLRVPLSAVIPFWDPALLAANDRAFTAPSAASLAALRDGFGVRWLYADVTGVDTDALGLQADLRYRIGDFAVYELR